MKNNVYLKQLTIDFNPIGTALNTLVFMFIENKSVTHLSMNSCDLETEGIGQLQEGLIRTKGISHLYLANN